MIPSAIISQRVSPPKILTKITSTRGSDLIMRKEDLTVSEVAFPPVSRKLAQEPPCLVIASTVFMARPAPFTAWVSLSVKRDFIEGFLPSVPILPSPSSLFVKWLAIYYASDSVS